MTFALRVFRAWVNFSLMNETMSDTWRMFFSAGKSLTFRLRIAFCHSLSEKETDSKARHQMYTNQNVLSTISFVGLERRRENKSLSIKDNVFLENHVNTATPDIYIVYPP